MPSPSSSTRSAGPLAGLIRARARRWSPTTRGLLWATGAGIAFSVLNALMRAMTQQLDPLQSQFLRYLFGLIVLLPWLVWHGPAAFRARRPAGQFARGLLHTVGLVLWFLALPHLPLADTTAIGFTTPIFILIGARLVFREPMRWERWVATAAGFAGVLIVVAPRLGGDAGAGPAGGIGWHLLMLASAPVFAASFLLTKALTRSENAGTILLWQAVSVTLFSLPMALLNWQPPSASQWGLFLVAGMLGSSGHYCLTRSLAAADISATQSAKFLELIWAAMLGWLLFADVPTESALLGGALICAGTLWLARREAKARPAADEFTDTAHPP